MVCLHAPVELLFLGYGTDWKFFKFYDVTVHLTSDLLDINFNSFLILP